MAKTAGAILVMGDKLVVQRRDAGAPTGANQLSLFGGHFENHETPEQALHRELVEETSLPVKKLHFKYLGQARLHGHDNTYIFVAPIKSDHFKVFEGKRAEAYSLEELLRRDDIAEDSYAILKRLERMTNGFVYH